MYLDFSNSVVIKRPLFFKIIFTGVCLFASMIFLQSLNQQDELVFSVTNVEQERKQQQIYNAYGRLPQQFEENLGQLDPAVKFRSHGAGYSLYLTSSETVLVLQPSDSKQQEAIIRMQFVGAQSGFNLQGQAKLPGEINYLTGAQTNWHTHIPTYGNVLASDVYPGIDVRYYGQQSQLEYDFIVQPGISPKIIRIRFEGIDSLSLDDEGNLRLMTATGELHHQSPLIYQEIEGQRIKIEGHYLLHSSSVSSTPLVGFEIAAYDLTYPLIIDPILDYATYLGGESIDIAMDVVLDDQGYAYVTGQTFSSGFPVLNALQTNRQGNVDSFVVKLSPTGDSLVYSTYFGGSGSGEVGHGITVNAVGEVFIVGTTDSATDFPLINAFQLNYGGGSDDAYLLKLNSDGGSILYSTFLGGKGSETALDVAVDSLDQVVVVGVTGSSNFPLFNPLQAELNKRGKDGFITKFTTDGASLVFSTFFGGTKEDVLAAVALDSSDRIYIVGKTTANSDFPIVNALQPLFGGSGDAFLARLQANGGALDFSTYLGGSLPDFATAVSVDNSNHILITGMTWSNDFPLNNPLQPVYGGLQDVFVTKLTPDATAIVFSTFLGGESIDMATDIGVDGEDNIYLTGLTASTLFPVADPLQTAFGGFIDAFVTKLPPQGDQLLFSTYLGGAHVDEANALAVDEAGNMLITGSTLSFADFPLVNPLQPAIGGLLDAFVVRIRPDNYPPEIISTPITIGIQNQLYSYDVNATDKDSDDILEYRLTVAPIGMTIDPVSGLISWIPGVLGDINIEVVVNDGKIDSDSQAYTLTITAQPVITSIPIIEVITGELYSYDVDATSADNFTLVYSLPVFPTGMIIDSDTGIISWSPTIAAEVSVTAQVEDTLGGIATQSFNIIVSDPDITPPEITITSPQDNLQTNIVNQIIIGSLNEIATLTINGSPVTLAADNSFSHTVELIGGNNVFTLVAIDPSGNTTTKTLTFWFDGIAPVITISAPQNNLITTVASQAIIGNLSEIATLSLNGNPITIAADLSFNHAVTLVEGNNVLTLTATDPVGNISSQTLTLVLDTTGAVITVTSVQDGLITGDAIQSITGSLNETASLTINGVAVTVTGENLFNFAISLAQGSNTIILEAIDALGNTSSKVLTLTLDTDAPTLEITSHQDGFNTLQAMQTLIGNVGEAASLTLNGNPITIASDNSFNHVINLVEGDNTLTFIATDLVGNAATNVITLTLDTTAPIITISSPQDNVIVGQPKQLIIGNLNELASLSINGQDVSIAQDSSFQHSVVLIEGSNSYNLVATDSLGNQSSQSLTMTLDSGGVLIITMTSPEQDTVTNQTSQNITGSMNLAGTLTINGNAVIVQIDNSFSHNVSLNEGENTFNIVGTQSSTNTATQNLNIILDTIAPVITVISPIDGFISDSNQLLIEGNVSEAVDLTINDTVVALLNSDINPLKLGQLTIDEAQGLALELDRIQGVYNLTGQIRMGADNDFIYDTLLSQGNNTFDITATDLAGNTSSVSLTVTK